MAYMLSPLLKRYTWNSAWLYYARIFIALCGTTAFPWWLGDVKLTIPLTLGMVAAALTDLDDRLAGRLRNLIITLFCFFIASASVELLFPWPWLFAIGLTLSTSGFILLGGLGQRYATIAFGALLIAIYTMLGTSLYEHWYQQPMYLLAGAVWYNVLTLIGHLLFPVRPLQDNLARCYEQLARYLELKSRMFDPDIEDESQAPLYDLALANGLLMATLNQTKLSLLTRLRGDRGQRGTRRTLHYYFVAQDIHERASSSHIQYQTLREHFRHSDVLFRFQRLMSMQGQACQQLSRCILLRQPYQHDPHFERAFTHIDAALERMRDNGAPADLLKTLGFLLNNLRAIDAQLATIESEQAQALPHNNDENELADDSPHGLSDIWLRLSRHFTPESALFRHAVRMSLVLCFGYAIIQITGMHHGYWILLTSLFVCQPNYNATRHRLKLRIIGTPGILKPSYKLQESMMRFVQGALKDADVILYVTDVVEGTDRRSEIFDRIARSGIRTILVINKIDLTTPERLEELVGQWRGILPDAEIVPVSALNDFNIGGLFDRILAALPEGEPFYPKDALTDKTLRFFASEIIREKIFLNYEKEIPYSVEIAIEEYKEEPSIDRISATIYVARESQKGIVIGHRGERLKRVGTQAREELEQFLGKKVFLQLFVKVNDNWRNDDRQLRRFGYIEQ